MKATTISRSHFPAFDLALIAAIAVVLGLLLL